MLGRFDTQKEAVEARKSAEAFLKKDPDAFVAYC